MTKAQSETQEISCSADLGRPILKTLERSSFTECWLTVLARGDLAPAEACHELFASVAGILASYDIEPIQEKIYGHRAFFDEIMKARASAYGKRDLPLDLPVTLLEGTPVRSGSKVAGIQIWGIKRQKNSQAQLKTIRLPDFPAARSLSAPGLQMLYLPSVLGKAPSGLLPPTAGQQAECMFARAEECLCAFDMSFLDVARTWIYSSSLLDWYGEFNGVRSRFFKTHSIGQGESVFPASTGIQGRTGDEECVMDVLAIKTDPARGTALRPLQHSSRQNQAFKYGSAFSRGMSILAESKQTVHISGTASIGTDGATRYKDEVEAQIMETLLSISALLAPVGGSLKDITSATLFCKDAAFYSVFRELTSLLGVSDFPLVPVVADVCRPDLLVEIEAVAAIAERAKPVIPLAGFAAPGGKL
jgi:enamine deaminase RidA (YjgF/YER057c/UK114 family)